MRALLVLIALMPLAAHAQGTDPNPPWSYDPIGVGNVRAYAQEGTGPMPYWRTDSPAALTLDGERWVVRRTQRFLRHPDLSWRRDEDRMLVRFDTAAVNVAVRGGAGDRDHLYPCRLDLPIPAANPAECGDGSVYSVWGELSVQIGSESVTRPVRAFDGAIPGPVLAAGIGDVGGQSEGGGAVRLAYAVVGGEAFSSRPEFYPATDLDPTPAHRYYPLAVGNEWQYEWRGIAAEVVEVVRRVVTGTVEVDGQTYFEIAEDRTVPGDPTWTPAGTRRLRFDTLSARVLSPEGLSLTPCPFDEPFNLDAPQVFCGDGETASEATYATGGPLTVETTAGPVGTRTREYPHFAGDSGTQVYVAGIGDYGQYGFWDYNVAFQLRYARVLQDDGSVWVVGTRYPVATGGGPERAPLALTASPSPTAGPLALALDVPEAGDVAVEAFDALGRRVWRHAARLGVGAHRVAVDASEWAPGLYVVRARVGEASASAVVVRR